MLSCLERAENVAQVRTASYMAEAVNRTTNTRAKWPLKEKKDVFLQESRRADSHVFQMKTSNCSLLLPTRYVASGGNTFRFKSAIDIRQDAEAKHNNIIMTCKM